MTRRLKHQIICFLIFCVPGMAALGFSFKLAAEGMALRSSGLSETGAIVGYERQKRRGLGQRVCPAVGFSHQGANYKFTDGWCNKSPKQFPAGTPVKVVFNAMNPQAARIDEFAPLFAPSLMVGVIAAPWLLLGVALVIRIR